MKCLLSFEVIHLTFLPESVKFIFHEFSVFLAATDAVLKDACTFPA